MLSKIPSQEVVKGVKIKPTLNPLRVKPPPQLLRDIICLAKALSTVS
jgi:hypothetical protein